MRTELRALALAKRYFVRQGYTVEDVSRRRGHNGYDLLIEGGGEGELKRIEVKGATRRWGIPDPYSTEFDANKRLVADILCVVYFIDDELPQICLIPRDAISPDFVSQRTGWRISSRFKKEGMLRQYMRPIPFAENDG